MHVLVDPDGRIVGASDIPFDSWPEGAEPAEVPDSAIAALPEGAELEDCTWDGGALTWHDPGPQPLNPAEVIKAIFTASPALTVGIVDALARRMAPYLPDYDSSATYAIGTLVVMDGVVKRRTIGGWREVA